MLKDFSDIAPKALVAAAALWAGANYFLIGPEVAARVVRADHAPACVANHHAWAVKAGEEKAKALPGPSVDPSKEIAAQQLRQFNDNPMMQELRRLGAGQLFGGAFDLPLRQFEEQKQKAKEAYNRAIERIEKETATELGKAGDICGCVADAAIADTRTEWAVFSGSLGLIRPAPIKSFGEKIKQTYAAGLCFGKAGA